MRHGFTLIELSIVLVIIGLIVGGVLVGQNLITASTVRAQVTQIERYNTAANTFRSKYGYLPGDIKNPDAVNFGFQSRGSYAGEGDGNGIVQGVVTNAANNNSGIDTGGEAMMFWVDLSTAHMLDGTFNTATPTSSSSTVIPAITSLTALAQYLPPAKLQNNFVYVWSGGYQAFWQETMSACPCTGDGYNYYAVSSFTVTPLNSTPAMTVAIAYAIDKKMDDGYPQTGNVTAEAPGQTALWAAGGGAGGASNASTGGSTTAATAGSATTCYDNGGNSGTQKYSVTQSNGANPNCMLSFRFQ